MDFYLKGFLEYDSNNLKLINSEYNEGFKFIKMFSFIKFYKSKEGLI